jgi:hypothetical protein
MVNHFFFLLKRTYKVSCTTLIALSISTSLSACSAFKPEHPQAFQSFSDRRPPRDNSVIMTGAVNTKKNNEFTTYSSNKNSDVNYVPVNNDVTSKQTDDNVSYETQNNQVTRNVNSQKSQGSFFERLSSKVFGNNNAQVKTNNYQSDSQELPQQNIYKDMRAPREQILNDSKSIGEGSGSGYSYYELADEILPAVPVPHVEHEKIKDISYDANEETEEFNTSEFGKVALIEKKQDNSRIIKFIDQFSLIKDANATESSLPPLPHMGHSSEVNKIVNTQTNNNVSTIPSQTNMGAQQISGAQSQGSLPHIENAPMQPVSNSTQQAPVSPQPVEQKQQVAVPSVPANPSATQEQKGNTPANSVPMVELPKEPTTEQLKQESNKLPEPNLQSVPPVPEAAKTGVNLNAGASKNENVQAVEQNHNSTSKVVESKDKKPVVKKKKKVVKKVHKKVEPKPVTNDSQEMKVLDSKTELKEIDGKPVLTGTLGELSR